MAMTQDFIAVGVFLDAEQAKHAIDELKNAGYSENEIGYLARATTTGTEDDTLSSAATGSVEGGIIGGVLGAAAALLIPGFGPAIAGGILLATIGAAGIGALAGGLIGALVSIGVPEEEAHHYQHELKKGHTIVTVKASSGYDDVIAIMRRNRAIDAKIRYCEFNAEPPLRPYGSTLPPESE
ncbi:MAG TPA: hypothetical protein VED37_18690 [Ktedonobacteraceae bacterium]|nr:hypothetical protein [Ktedonobacteraceae bacterium]